jgi:hypothetical protein
MTRTELVKSVKDKTGVTLDIAERTIAAIQASMIKSLKKTIMSNWWDSEHFPYIGDLPVSATILRPEQR